MKASGIRTAMVRLFGGVTLLLGATHARAQTYFIDESTDFTGNGCPNTDLNVVTSLLRDLLGAYGWGGSRYVNVDAWPHDFVEACSGTFGSGGLDSTYADAAHLTVYAGHGNTGRAMWGFARNSMCRVDMASSPDLTAKGVMRLGQMSGATGTAAVWLTSCTLKQNSLPAKANFQWLKQQFGFHNSPSIAGDQPAAFYNTMVRDAVSNKQAWLDAMEDKPGAFTGDNSPIVVSYGSTSAQANSTHNSFRFHGQVMSPRTGGPACGGGPPGFFFVSTLRDHGTSASCE